MTTELSPWVTIVGALLTPTVAGLGLYIAWRQWKTAQARLKFDLFEKRYAVYHAVRKFIGSVAREGHPDWDSIFVFDRETGDSVFLFNSEIEDYLELMRKNALELRGIVGKLKAVPAGPEREAITHRYAELSKWIMNQNKAVAGKFSPYLRLGHR